ncbi:AAA family ATPase [Nocardioides rubriscoriae]|uniref:AAA family ATPase n=1 Tax=Nocardioides rubriscoriae TaxID=642762 RepID=UPI0011E04608|nr:AAA family ATPase [Nocardioides rubriscoriae]
MHLVMLFGPPAVGKMTVGREIARLTSYRLFHNHATIEPLLGVFDFGTPPFDRLKNEFRTRVFQEAVAHGLPGLVFTVVWALDDASDSEIVEQMIAPVVDAGHPVDFVELWSSQETRLAREGTPLRLEHKASKRDVAWARGSLREWDGRHRLSTGPDQPFPFAGRYPHLRVDNDDLSPADAAEQVVAGLGLPRSSAPG